MANTTPPSMRPPFDSVDTSFDPTEVSARDDVESPSLSSSNALARFEFEPGRSKEGTKVLMVEWEDDAYTEKISGDWEISWDGKKTVLPARDQARQEEADERPVNRLYFLLGSGVAVPSTVQLQKGSVAWKTNPLPAIFSPELGATARQSGKKGVLHTIWAKKRLQVLQTEIANESKVNAEGIGLEMAIAEKEWIEQNFGVVARPGQLNMSAMSSVNFNNGPSSPRSPGGGRLMDKLRGLKIGTSERDLSGSGSDENAQQANYYNPLSPETADVAIGSFGNFAALKGTSNPPTIASKTAEPHSPQSRRKIAAQKPPDSIVSQQRQQQHGMASLNAFAAGVDSETGFSHETESAGGNAQDDLFALPMSPRSPEMTKSPFSFGSQDTMRYLKGEKA